MNDEILKKLEARLDRRSFLRGSSIGVAALLGVAAASPLVVFAQAPQDSPEARELVARICASLDNLTFNAGG